MYNKYLIIASKDDEAGINITTQLSQFKRNIFTGFGKNPKGFDFYLVEGSILSEDNLDMDKINKYDFVIFASKHESKNKEKTLSVHAPGNWREARGGQSRKICRTSAFFQKQLLMNIRDNVKKYDLKDYKITLEATHHGPLISKPCIFVEIGSTPLEWKHRRTGFVLAKTIADTIEKFKENPYNEVVIGIGGPHYCPNFTRFQLNSNLAVSHVIPQYVMPITEEMIKQAWEKTEEEVDFAVVDWKGLGKSEQRDEVIKILEENRIPWKKSKDIKR